MLQYFKADGLVIKEQTNSPQSDIKKSIKKSVNEINMVKNGKLQSKSVEDLLNVL